jgi:hypothetical protein
MTLEDLLAKVGLKEKVQVFKDEQIDMELMENITQLALLIIPFTLIFCKLLLDQHDQIKTVIF